MATFARLIAGLSCLICLSFGLVAVEVDAAFTPTTFAQLSQNQIPQQPYPIFRSILSDLKANTRVPLLLPVSLPQEDYPLYATLNLAQPEAYEITIGSVENCSGGNYCRYGTVSGEKIAASTPSIEAEYAFLNDPTYQPTERSPEKMETLVLANGIKAYFVPYICGANCDDSKVVFNWNGYRYLAGIKRAKKETVLNFANSMYLIH